jgi:DNA-binding GntR family transcriptional regulator
VGCLDRADDIFHLQQARQLGTRQNEHEMALQLHPPPDLAVLTPDGDQVPRRDRIADALREDIMSGRLKPGERLPEEVIAKEHHVSRVPVREAFRRLESEGFVTLAQYHGARVSETSWRDSIELMQVRRGLEVMAARLAADTRGGEYAAALTDVVERGKAAGRKQHLEELPGLIMEFHELVAKASGNRQLENMIELVLQRISWGFHLELKARIDSAWLDHSLIAMAILNGSATQAAILMDEHIVKDEVLARRKYAEPEDAGPEGQAPTSN